MPAFPTQLEGWDLSPPVLAWQGFHLHPATRPGAATAVGTCWLADTAVELPQRAAWQQRIAALRSWSHPGFTAVISGGLWEQRPWALTTPIRKGSLWSHRTNVAPHEAELAVIAQQVLDVLAFAHARGVVHGALGPDALLVERGACRVAGLGLLDVAANGRADPAGSATATPQGDLTALATLLCTLAGPDGLPPGRLPRLAALLRQPDTTAADALEVLGPVDVPAADSAEAPVAARIGRYTLITPIGQGAMGAVWRARDPDLDREVAVKIHHPAAMLAAHAVERFRQEARAAGRLDHPAIVRILDFGSAPEGLYYAMELVDGTDLAARLREVGRIAPPLAARWAASVARGLAHAHRQGIVHRDLKPANILLEKGDRPRVTDFGLAFSIGDMDARITRDGQVMGTPVYMSPEQASGRLDEIGPKSDVYSLGAVLYEMLAGRPPFRDGPAPAVVHEIVYGSPAPLRTVAPDVPADLALICTQAMEPERRRRYATMDRFADDLERFLVGEPISARPPSLAARMRSVLRRHRGPAVTAAGVLTVAAVIGATWSLMAAGRVREEAARDAAAARALAGATASITALEQAGDHAAARQAFAELMAQPVLQGTPSWAAAWFGEAERRAGQGDDAGARVALGHIWLDGDTAVVRRRALTAVAGSWRGVQRYDEVDLVLTALARDVDAGAPTAPERQLALETALYRWETEGVTHPAAPLVAALATRVPVLGAPVDARLEPIAARDGRPGVLVAADGSHAWHLTAAGDASPLPDPPPGTRFVRLFRSPDGRLHAVSRGGDTLRVLRLEGGWQTEGTIEVPALVTCDLLSSGDREPRIVVSSEGGRKVALIERSETSGWTLGAPLWPAAALNSDYGGAAAADLDQDGVDELIVGTGAWGAYDVRVYEAVGGRMLLRGRKRLGEVGAPMTLRLPGGRPAIAAGVLAQFENRRIFGDTPRLEGIAWLGVAQSGLEEIQELRTPGGCALVAAGDADGDSLDDLFATCGGVSMLIRQVDGQFSPAAVSDFHMAGAADLDGDGALEVLAREAGPDGARLVVAGLGEEPRPPAPRRTLPVHETPAHLTGGDAARWQRDQALSALGLNLGAMEAAVLPTKSLSADDRLRRAQIEFGAGLYEAAARSAAAAVDGGTDPALAQERASTAALLAIDPEAARAVTAVTTGPVDPALRDLAALPRFAAQFDQPLAPRWILSDPGALRWEQANQALRVTPTAERVLARLPLDLVGGAVRLEVELDLEEADWDGGLTIALVPEGDATGAAPIQVFVRAEGGGGTVSDRVRVRFGGGAMVEATLEDARRVAATHGRVRVVAAMDTGTGRIRARVDLDGAPLLLEARTPLSAPVFAAGRHALVLSGGSAWAPNARFVAHLRRLSVDGATMGTGPVASTGVELATALLANTRADDALTTLRDAEGPAADEVRMWALLELGRAAEAAVVYRRRLLRGPVDASLLAPVRSRPLWAVEVLEHALGPRGQQVAWSVWRPSVVQLPDDASIGRAFTGWAEEVVVPGVGAQASEEALDLTVNLARVARMQGRLSLAANLLTRIGDGGARQDGDEGERRAILHADVATELARVAAARGEEDLVRTHLTAALHHHPAPEALAEVVSADPLFEETRRAGWWAPLVEPFRRYGARAGHR